MFQKLDFISKYDCKDAGQGRRTRAARNHHQVPDALEEAFFYVPESTEEGRQGILEPACSRGKIWLFRCTPSAVSGFPRPVHANAILNDVVDLIGVPGSVAKTYWLARQMGDEQYVNDYCPAISIAWRANTDIQYIMGGMFDIVAYVSGYATKTEANKENHDLRESLKGSHEFQGRIQGSLGSSTSASNRRVRDRRSADALTPSQSLTALTRSSTPMCPKKAETPQVQRYYREVGGLVQRVQGQHLRRLLPTEIVHSRRDQPTSKINVL